MLLKKAFYFPLILLDTLLQRNKLGYQGKKVLAFGSYHQRVSLKHRRVKLIVKLLDALLVPIMVLETEVL